MYSSAVDVEVEDKSGDLERLVENSMHFRTMNVREARSPSLSGRRLRMSPHVNGSNPWFNFGEKLVISAQIGEIAPIAKVFRAKNDRV
jgi:hypothetical protein